MNYQEAVAAVKQNPEKSFIGIILRPSREKGIWFFSYYRIEIPDIEDEDWIGAWYEGGCLFSDLNFCIDAEDGQDFFSLDELQEEAKKIEYKSTESLLEYSGLLSEYALFNLLPDLPDPELIFDEEEQAQFIKLAVEKVKQWAQ